MTTPATPAQLDEIRAFAATLSDRDLEDRRNRNQSTSWTTKDAALRENLTRIVEICDEEMAKRARARGARPATYAQIEYINSLGGTCPEGTTIAEASAMITGLKATKTALNAGARLGLAEGTQIWEDS